MGRAKGAHSNDPFFKGIPILSVGRTQCLKYKTQDLYGNPFLRFPLAKPGRHAVKEDLPQMIHYCIEAAVLRLLLEHGYNYTNIYDPRVQLIIQNVNLTDTAIGEAVQPLWAELQNETAHNMIKANLSISNETITEKSKYVSDLLNEAYSDFSFITAKAIRDILYVPDERSKSLELKSPDPRSHLLLMERTKYPRHCKNLHDPRMIKVKVIHSQLPT